MPVEQEAIAEPELDEIPAGGEEQDIETPETEPEAELDTEQPAEDEELEEFEFNQRKLKAPKWLKADLESFQAGVTRKLQDTANLRRELEQRAQSLNQQAQQSQDAMNVRANLAAINAEIARLSNVDWDTWRRSDFYAAEAGKDRLAALKDGKAQAEGWLHDFEAEQVNRTNSDTSNRLAETRAYAEKNIKGWTPEIDAEVTNFVLSKGISPELFLGSVNPAIYELAHLAMIGAKALSKPTVTKNPTPVPALRTVAGKSTAPAAKPMEQMGMDEYAAYRQRQMKAANSRR